MVSPSSNASESSAPSIIVVRVKRPRQSSPVDDLAVHAAASKRQMLPGNISSTARQLAQFTMGTSSSQAPSNDAIAVRLFQRVDTLSSDDVASDTTLVQARLRERLRELKGDRVDAMLSSSLERGRLSQSRLAQQSRAQQLDKARFTFIDFDPSARGDDDVKSCDFVDGTSTGGPNYRRIMDRYRSEFAKMETDCVWDVFIYGGAATASELENSATIDLEQSWAEVDDVGRVGPLVFGDESEDDVDSEDSNDANNPNLSYPEDEDTDPDEYDTNDSDECEIFSDGNLDSMDDFDQT